jgi:hypothetical protein
MKYQCNKKNAKSAHTAANREFMKSNLYIFIDFRMLFDKMDRNH